MSFVTLMSRFLRGRKNKFCYLGEAHTSHMQQAVTYVNKSTQATTTATTTDVTDCVSITDVSVILCTTRSGRARSVSPEGQQKSMKISGKGEGGTPHCLGENRQKTTIPLYNTLQ